MTQPKTKKTTRYILTAYHNTDKQLHFMEVVMSTFIRAQGIFFRSKKIFSKCSMEVMREDGKAMQTELEPESVVEPIQPPTPQPCTDPELRHDCTGCTDPNTEGTHQGCTKHHGHVGCALSVPGKYDFKP